MSMSYSPSNGATHDSFWAPIYLAYRDITGQAPIDKVSYPGVSVTAACSPDDIFDETEYQTCLSNLLAAEFRRFIFDLYWDTVNRNFNLCPVQLPQQSVNATAQNVSTSPATSAQPQTKRSLATGLGKRQPSNSTALGSSIASEVSSTTTSSSTIPSTTDSSGSALYQLGQYQCSQGLTLQSILDLFNSYIDNTSDQVLARLVIMEFNLHAAASPNDPDGPASTPSTAQMPSGSELVGNTIDNFDDLRRDLYTLSDLLRDRSDLNASWYAVGSETALPFTHYFTVSENSNRDLSTDDGWPNEAYLLFTKYARMLVSWGSVDEQMTGYNFDADSSVIFPRGYMQAARAFEESAVGSITSGCFFNDKTTSVANDNDTWAMGFVDNPQNADQQTFIGNLTACGIAPNLNTSLTDFSAADNFTIYQQFTEAAIFGWASGEPRNTSSPGTDSGDGGNQYRCVILDSSDAYLGHWRVENCQQNYRAACRINDQPFSWQLSSSQVAYGNAPDACPGNTTFSLPRTALENNYLYHQILSEAVTQKERRDQASGGVWINLNSLDVQNCWVTSGPNGTCVYDRDQNSEHDREVLIPTIAALIVLFLTVLTIAIKCNNNIRHHRRSKTGPGGWEYEGVPS